jgi:hypothetical protein
MSKPQKLFRYIWRINAILILVATGAITFGVGFLLLQEFGSRTARNSEGEAGVPVAGSNANLSLRHVSLVEGTNVMQADLVSDRGGKGFSSGGYSETRNILFIQSDQKEARWLLPDNDHIISDRSDIREDTDRKSKKLLATAVFVKPATSSSETGGGRVLLFDPAGARIVEVAINARELHFASQSGGDVEILFERNRRLVLAAFDPGSLAKRREQEIDVPPSK